MAHEHKELAISAVPTKDYIIVLIRRKDDIDEPADIHFTVDEARSLLHEVAWALRNWELARNQRDDAEDAALNRALERGVS